MNLHTNRTRQETVRIGCYQTTFVMVKIIIRIHGINNAVTRSNNIVKNIFDTIAQVSLNIRGCQVLTINTQRLHARI